METLGQFTDAENLLRFYATKCVELENEADEALQVRNTKGHKSKLLERAKIIRDLPKIVKALNFSLPENAREVLSDLSTDAADSIKRGKLFGLSVVGIPRGSKLEDPDLLTKLVSDLYDKKR